MTPTDFKAAREALKKADKYSFNRDDLVDLADTFKDHRKQVMKALSIAEAIMKEPSEGMKIAGDHAGWWCGDKWKAMRDEMLREIEGENGRFKCH